MHIEENAHFFGVASRIWEACFTVRAFVGARLNAPHVAHFLLHVSTRSVRDLERKEYFEGRKDGFRDLSFDHGLEWHRLHKELD